MPCHFISSGFKDNSDKYSGIYNIHCTPTTVLTYKTYSGKKLVIMTQESSCVLLMMFQIHAGI